MDYSLLIKKAISYLIEGLAVAFVAIVMPSKQLKVQEIVILGIVATATFAILDVFTTMGSSVRQGAGFGLGFKLVGFP
jgi:hypothetical protein